VRDQAVRLGLKLGLDLVIVNPEARPLGGGGGQSQRRNAHQKDNDAPQGPWCVMHEQSPVTYPLVLDVQAGRKDTLRPVPGRVLASASTPEHAKAARSRGLAANG
jgi:hypothetical protein